MSGFESRLRKTGWTITPVDGACDNLTTTRLLRLISPKFPKVNVYSRIHMPPLGLLYVGASVEKAGGWRVEIIEENNYRGELNHEKLQEKEPADAVGFYVGLTSTAPRIYELAKLYKKMGVRTMGGGSHVDALPDEALANGIDVVVRGEGEFTSVEVLNAWFDGGSLDEVDGIAFRDEMGQTKITKRRTPIHELDSLALPNFDQLKNLRYPINWMPISRTRGCNFSCEFCTVRDQQGKARSKSPERTYEEIANLVERGSRNFFITDDNFAQDRDGTVQLCRMITDLSKAKHIKLQFTVQLRAESARDDELMDAMWQAGVKIICIGLESPIPEDLKTMRKGQTVEGMERDIAAIRQAGFYIHGMFIFGYPNEEGNKTGLTLKERANLYLDFIKRTRIDTIQILKAVPIPGSKLAERLKKAGQTYPLEDVGWDKYDGNFLCFEPKDDDPEELQLEATRILKEFYRPVFLLKAIGLLPLLPFDIIVHRIRLARAKSAAIVQSKRLAAGRELETRRLAASKYIETKREIAGKHIEAGREAAARMIEHSRMAQVARKSRLHRSFRNAIYRYGGSRILSTWHRIANVKVFLEVLRKVKRSREVAMK